MKRCSRFGVVAGYISASRYTVGGPAPSHETTRALRILAVTFALSALFAPRSFADPITLSFQGVGGGSIDGRPFSNAAFTISGIGDTVNRQALADDLFSLLHNSASISIAEVGTFIFLVPTRTFIRQFPDAHAGLVGFSRGDGLDLYDGPTSPLLATWDMLSSIGPVSGTAVLLQWEGDSGAPDVLTTGGVLRFNRTQSPAVFTATAGAAVVPEPGTLALVTLGLAATRIATRQRRRSD